MIKLKQFFIILGILLPCVLLGQSKKVIPLKNSGFESEEKVKGCRTAPFWRDYSGGSFELTNDAYSGKKALKMKGKGFIRQAAKIAPEEIGKPMTVRLYAKGTGILHFFFTTSWKNEKGKVIHTSKGWKTREVRFPLTTEYLPYTFTYKKILPKSSNVEINFGASSSLNAIVDDVELFIGKPKKAKQEPEAKIPADVKLINIAPYAKIRTTPYGTLVTRMTDGIPHTGLSLEKHPLLKTQAFEFIYDKPKEVAQIRFSLPSKNFVLRADTNGDGKYDKVLTLEENFKTLGYWSQKDWQYYEKSFWPAVKAYAVKLVNFSKRNNAIFDFQILVPEKSVSKDLIKTKHHSSSFPVAEAGKTFKVPPPKSDQRYLQGFHIEPWMFDSPGWLKKEPRPPLKDWPAFQKMVKEMKRMHCNLVWMFPPKTWVKVKGRHGGGYPYDVMWPSKYFKWSHPENLLKEFCDEMHKSNIKVFIQWRFPGWEKMELPTEKKEVALMGKLRRLRFSGVAEELIDADVDGVPLCLDEEYFGGVRYPGHFAKEKNLTKAKNEAEKKKWIKKNAIIKATQAAFKKRWKTDKFPNKYEDSELFRQWVLFYYEQIAAGMKEVAESAKKKNPDTLTATNIVACESFNNRMRWGAAYDIIGHTADIDYFGTDPYHTMEDSYLGYLKSGATTKALAAGSKKRQSVVTLNFPWGWGGRKKHPLTYEVCPPISVMGSVMNSVMQGGTAFAFWRYNLSFLEGYDKYVEQVYGMLDTMAAWGAKEAAIPRDIAILRSRASEDWWQLKVRKGDYSGNRGDEIMGYSYYKWLAELMMTRGYPFELYYQDQPDSYKNLSDFKLVILPFPYSISKKVYTEIEKAANKGTKILIFGKQGETDEIGNAYNKPLLKKLIDSGKAEFISEKIEDVGHFPEFIGRVVKKIDGLLGDSKTLTFNGNGSAVQAGCLEKSTTEKFIILINWGNNEATVDLGIKIPSGKKYSALMRDLNNTTKITINGKDTFSASELKNFSVKVKKNGIKVLYITKK